MQSIAVIYQSRYGHAKTYAGWIAEALNADLLETPKAAKLDKYDTLVFGGGLYAGGISGAKFITKNFAALKQKNLAVFTVGLAATTDPTIFRSTIDRVFPREMQRQIRFFHLRGGIDYTKLGPVHRTMMGVLKRSVQRKKQKTADEIMLLETYGGRVDFRDKSSIAPILEYVRGLEGAGL